MPQSGRPLHKHFGCTALNRPDTAGLQGRSLTAVARQGELPTQIQLCFHLDSSSNTLDDELLECIDVARIQSPGRTQNDPDQWWPARSYLDDTQTNRFAGKLNLTGRNLPQYSPLIDKIDESDIERYGDNCRQQYSNCKPYLNGQKPPRVRKPPPLRPLPARKVPRRREDGLRQTLRERPKPPLPKSGFERFWR